MSLKLLNLSYSSYSGKKILTDISLNFNDRGKIYGILGPSGAGKSTLLKCIAGILELPSGMIEYLGRNLCDTPVSKRPISFLQQSFPLYENLTVYENVKISLLSFNKKERDEKSKEIPIILSELGINSEIWNRKPKNLSGGEAQRIALAKCLLKKCEIMLLDEPLSNIDKNTKLNIVNYILNYVNENKLLCFMVSHDEDDSFLMCDEFIYLNNGMTIQSGTLKELLETPQSALVLSMKANYGLSVITRNILEKLFQNIELNLPYNNYIKIAWKSDSANLKLLSFQDHNDPLITKKIILPVEVQNIRIIGDRVVYILLLHVDNLTQYLWYQIESLQQTIVVGSKILLEIPMTEIYYLDDKDKIIKQGSH
jgi:ABC-type sugar transport system ATPase subunit